jgi:hypothetical protein
MCLLSWLLPVKAFPQIWQIILPGSIPHRGYSCSGGAVGNLEGFLICLPHVRFLSIKTLQNKASLLNS